MSCLQREQDRQVEIVILLHNVHFAAVLFRDVADAFQPVTVIAVILLRSGDHISKRFIGWRIIFDDNQQQAEPYRLPLMWLINQALLLSLTGGYPYSTSLTYRQQVLLHHKKKTDWWYSKCLWCVGTVASFYLLCYVVAAVWCFLFHMPFQTAFSAEYAKIWYEVNMENVTGRELWLLLTVLPFAISTAMALLQLFLGLAFGSQLAFLLSMGVQAASTVLCLPWLPGNYSMILRSTIIDANGVKTEWRLCLAAGIAFLSTLLGGVYIRKRDIL